MAGIERFLALEAEAFDPAGAILRGQQIGQQRRAGQQQEERNRLLQEIDTEKLSQLKERREIEDRDRNRATSLKFARTAVNSYDQFKTPEELQQFHTVWRNALGRENRGALSDVPEVLTPEFMQQTQISVAAADEALQAKTKASATTSTANIKDFEFYNDLKAKDPESATMFAMDVGLIPKDKPISAVGEKELINSQNAFFQSSRQAREYDLLAGDYERIAKDLPAGSRATFGEFMARVAGTQDEQTELRRRFAKVRLSEALKFLPPGPATDRDVEEAFKGVPADNASPEQIQSFLRGASKMALIDAEFQQFKSDYISKNDNTKGMLTEWKSKIRRGDVQSINSLTPAGEIRREAPPAEESPAPQAPQVFEVDF